MFRFLAKSAVATYIWKRYRRPIVATLLLFVGYFFIGMLHGDYVEYATGADDRRHLWLSYLIKWCALIGITLLYYLVLSRFLSSGIEKLPPAKKKRTDEPAPSTTTADGTPDPFSVIRHKEKLQSRADIAIKQPKK